MKKGTKTVGSILLVLAMALSFVACGREKNNTGSKVSQKQQSEKEARIVAEEFLNEVSNCNLKKAKTYVTAGTKNKLDGWDEVEGKDTLKKTLTDSMGGVTEALPKKTYDKIDVWSGDLVDKVVENISYEIDSAECTEENKVVVKGVFKYKDFEKIGSSIEVSDSEKMAEDIIRDAYKKGTITEKSSEADIIDVAIEGMLDIMKDEIVKCIDNLDVLTDNFELVMRKNDGKWTIIADESTGLDDLGNMAK